MENAHANQQNAFEHQESHPLTTSIGGTSMAPPQFKLENSALSAPVSGGSLWSAGGVVQRAVRDGEDKDAATNSTYAEHHKKRKEWGIPEAGSKDDAHTVAWLDDGNGHQYWGRNGHGRSLPFGMTANAISRTHAEGDVMIQAYNTGGIGKIATLVVDRAACDACGKYGGAKGMAKSVGFEALALTTPRDSDVDYYDLTS